MRTLLLNLNQRIKRFISLCLLGLLIFSFSPCLQAQNITLDGYVFEENNRGFLNEVRLTVLDFAGLLVASDTTDIDGHFSVEVPFGRDYIVLSEKRVFKTQYDTIHSAEVKMGEKMFVKIQLERQPGYLFEVTLAEKRIDYNMPTDAVSGARVEIYNNTKKQTVLSIDSTKNPVFSYTFEQGNHYTILARKKGYFNKRMEAHVNIDGCILCFEGVGTVTPGVVENISTAKNNQLGTLLANVELERVDSTRIMIVNNIYYDVASANLRADAKKELDKLAVILKINPHILVEIGSHTDSRGSAEANMLLSKARAQAAVDYLISKGNLKSNRIKAKGYGESLLTNGCKDGVPCSEPQHEQNRRTELKIVGITADPLADISLAEIIHAEELEKFVASGEAFSEEVYVAPTAQAPTQTPTTADNAAPKEVPQTAAQTVPQTAPTFSVLDVKKVPKEAIKSKIEKPALTTKTPTTKPYPKLDAKAEKSVPKEMPKETSTEIAKENARTTNTPKVEKVKVATQVSPPPSVPAPATLKAAQEAAVEQIAATPTIATPSAVEKAVEKNDLAAKGSAELPKPNGVMKVVLTPIPADFSGYSVELVTVPNEVAKDSPLLQGIAEQVGSNIFVEKRPNGVAYTVGSFETWGEVQDFQNKAAIKYPKAKIVEYFKGKRIE